MLKITPSPAQPIIADIHETFWDYFNSNIEPELRPMNVTEKSDVTAPDQGFVIGMYSALLVIGALGNVAVFTSLVRSRRRKSRVNLLMTHLVIADMIVTFFVIPLEIGWRTTNAWLAGNMACKFFLVFRAFGLYLSSNVLVCISVDRFFAVIYPLRLPIARKRSKTMLTFSWIIALVCSAPQSMVFKVMRHPKVPDFYQCVAFEAFASQEQELAYNVFCLCAVYFLPLLIITVCYACIFYEISKNSKEMSDKCQTDNSRIQLRRSDERPLARARRRTLRMTVTIVTVFACCWLPYATMTLWYMLDRQSALHVSPRVQDLFFIMAVSNSCMDPLVYGSYALDLKSVFARTIRKVLCLHTSPQDLPGTSAPATLKSKLPTNGIILPDTRQTNRAQRHTVRFEETSFGAPSACSDPSPYWCDRYSGSLDMMKQSKSCEVFTLHVPSNVQRASLPDHNFKTDRTS